VTQQPMPPAPQLIPKKFLSQFKFDFIAGEFFALNKVHG